MPAIRKTAPQTRSLKVWRSPGGRPTACTDRITVLLITVSGTGGKAVSGFYYEKTNNTRMNEGLSGGGEGRITNDQTFTTNRLTSYRTSGEVNVPVIWLFEQTLTVGAEWNRDALEDPSSTGLTVNDNNIAGISGSAAHRSSKNKSQISALYVEDNIEPMAGTNIIPGLRFDYLSESGSNF
ncbi:outer membrane receptor FepA [Salmonella enterica subsp. arizonae]|uniref:Outer membrane receptor FepA n=1 Tax=Salmonella enterica subsp. arizonae TaxID=59203 RepID=A0A379T9K6_SALER|nr:outer membrane receptor FepA [Salmonella enterica subsp. arizonae]